MAKHKIALIPGDGIGKEVLPEGVRVLEAAARRFNFQLEFTDFDWSCDRLGIRYCWPTPSGARSARSIRSSRSPASRRWSSS